MIHDTQIKIENWGQKNQDKIANSRVLISGSGLLSNLLLLNLAGLGVGNITIVDNNNKINDNEFLYKLSDTNYSKKIKNLDSIMRSLYAGMNTLTVNSDLSYSFLEKYDVVIDASNDPNKKAFCLEYVFKNKIPFISVVSSKYKSELRAISKGDYVNSKNKLNIDDYLFIDYENKEQGPIPSGVMASAAANIYRKFKFKLSDFEKISSYLIYNLKNKERIYKEDNCEINDYDCFKDIYPVIIGAGALGNPVVLGLTLSGTKNMLIIDDDIIDSTNLNRQFLYYNSENKHKVNIMKERLEKIKDINIEVINDRFSKEKYTYLFEKDNVIIVSCVDNFETRAELNELAVMYKEPLINASSNSELSSIYVYYPGKTPCLDCQFSLYEIAEKHRKRTKEIENSNLEARTCTADNHDPSVVYVNFAAGFIAAGEVLSYSNGSIIESCINFSSSEINQNKIFLDEKCYSKRGCGCDG